MSQHPCISSLVVYGNEAEVKLLSRLSQAVGVPLTKTSEKFDSMDFVGQEIYCELKRRSSEVSYYDEKIKKEGWLMPSCKVMKGWDELSKGNRVVFFYFWMSDRSLWMYEMNEGDFTQDGSHFVPRNHYDNMLHVAIHQDKWTRCEDCSDIVFEEDGCWID